MFRESIIKNSACLAFRYLQNTQKLNVFHRVHAKQHPPHAASFHNGSILLGKIYVDYENQFAHNILAHSLKPYQIIQMEKWANTADIAEGLKLPARLQQPPKQSTVEELFADFCTLVQYCALTNAPITDVRFENFIKHYCDSCHRLGDQQLLGTLLQIAKLPKIEAVQAANFCLLWNTLDIECCRRIDQWSQTQLLLACDAWYALGLSRVTDFVWEALRKLGRKVRNMPPEQLVQSMFYCNVLRRPISEMFDYEINLSKCAGVMTLQELGVMSMGFFKTQTPIRNPELMEELYKRLIAEVDTVEDITLVSILKIMRYSSRLPQVPSMMRLLEALIPQVERVSLLSCLHIALLGCEHQVCNDDLLERILQRFDRDMDKARIKDLERICLVMALFNVSTKSKIEITCCHRILGKLHTKIDEIIKYPRCFTNCMHYLTLKDVYDAEMISSALDARFTRHSFGKNMLLGRDFFHLDSYVKINLRGSNYEGNQLTDKQRRTMGKMFTQYIPERNQKFKLNKTDQILLDIKETTSTIFPFNNLKHILPHYERADLVICYDRKQRKTVPLSQNCPENYSGVILTRKELLGELDSTDIDTVAIVVAGWNNVVRDKNRNTGLIDMKLKQLQLLGHKYILIYWHNWRELETLKDRQNYLKRKLSSIINL